MQERKDTLPGERPEGVVQVHAKDGGKPSPQRHNGLPREAEETDKKNRPNSRDNSSGTRARRDAVHSDCFPFVCSVGDWLPHSLSLFLSQWRRAHLWVTERPDRTSEVGRPGRLVMPNDATPTVEHGAPFEIHGRKRRHSICIPVLGVSQKTGITPSKHEPFSYSTFSSCVVVGLFIFILIRSFSFRFLFFFAALARTLV